MNRVVSQRLPVRHLFLWLRISGLQRKPLLDVDFLILQETSSQHPRHTPIRSLNQKKNGIQRSGKCRYKISSFIASLVKYRDSVLTRANAKTRPSLYLVGATGFLFSFDWTYWCVPREFAPFPLGPALHYCYHLDSTHAQVSWPECDPFYFCVDLIYDIHLP